MEEEIPEFNSAYDKYVFYAKRYMLELAFSLLMVGYLLNFFAGKKYNSGIAVTFLNLAKNILD